MMKHTFEIYLFHLKSLTVLDFLKFHILFLKTDDSCSEKNSHVNYYKLENSLKQLIII